MTRRMESILEEKTKAKKAKEERKHTVLIAAANAVGARRENVVMMRRINFVVAEPLSAVLFLQ